ncbi:MAG: hypothetical protein EBZ77_10470, partial [Chitinophagia bacterium]|nr:hypothetical protein [Chitinophagia bacterium]
MWYLLIANTTFAFNAADSARGSNGPGRRWWDVFQYELAVEIDTTQKSLKGSNIITFGVTEAPVDSIQIDLQSPLSITGLLLSDVAG